MRAISARASGDEALLRQSCKHANQLVRLIRERSETVLPVEGGRAFVLGVHEQCMHPDMLQDQAGPVDSVHQKEFSQSLPLARPVHSQPPQPDAWHLVRQLPSEVRGQVLGDHLAGGQRVIPQDSLGRTIGDRNEGFRNAALPVLLRRLAQPEVKCGVSALEPVSIVVPTQRLNRQH